VFQSSAGLKKKSRKFACIDYCQYSDVLMIFVVYKKKPKRHPISKKGLKNVSLHCSRLEISINTPRFGYPYTMATAG